MSRKNLVIIGGTVAALLVAGALFAFVFNDDDALESPQDQTVVEDMPFEEGEETGTQESPQEDSPVTEAEKPNTPVTRVSEKPEVATGFGHAPDNPLKNGQVTSTTCTSEPNVDCVVKFRQGNDVITFETKKTDGDGVALWSWEGGADVPSGTWEVTATAGNKTSDKEIIYVQ